MRLGTPLSLYIKNSHYATCCPAHKLYFSPLYLVGPHNLCLRLYIHLGTFHFRWPLPPV